MLVVTLKKYKFELIYGACLAGLLFLLKWLQIKYITNDHSLDLYMGFIAILFLLIGIWIAYQINLFKQKTIVVEKKIFVPSSATYTFDDAAFQKIGLSAREGEVLQLMAEGKSNLEIADQLFISLSTVKTHASNIFVKMDVGSRTQAMEKAKRLNIIS